MSGRFALIHRPEEVAEFLAVDGFAPFPPRYNIAPTQPVLLAIAGPRRDRGSDLPERQALLARWGLIPGWAKDPAALPLLFNARSETAAAKPAFRAAMRHRRALIPASGFYEWRRAAGGPAQAFWVRPRHGGLIAFAALMETYAEAGGSEIDTAAVLTTRANADLGSIHPRMPVIVGPPHFARWLDCVSWEPRDMADLLGPAEPGLLETIPVSAKVDNVANAGPDILERVEPLEVAGGGAARQMTLF